MPIVQPRQAYEYAYKNGLKFPKDWQITANFYWNDAFKNETGDVPCIWIFYNLQKAFTELQKFRTKIKLQMVVNRAYSSVAHNKAAGSTASLSCHILGMAIDFYVIGLTIEQARNLLLSSKEIKVRIEKGTATWIHIDIGNPYITGGMTLGLFNP